jgi:beta-N-acetylhexosaminidase
LSHSVNEDAHAIILPAFAETDLSDTTKRFLDQGGISILLGETREEYVSRKMSDERRASETPDTFKQVVAEAKSHTDLLVVAVDQEVCGTCRLHDLVPQFPALAELTEASADELERISFEVGNAAVELGVNCFLAPVVDLLTGQNPWLQGRTYSTNPVDVGRVSSAYVRGVQRAGVAATAKHFPGFHNIALDPAIEADAKVTDALETFEAGFQPFRSVIDSDVEMIMVGPAIVEAFDREKAALRSKSVVNNLKQNLGYKGIVMADDLDSKAAMRSDSLEQVALDAVNAGCDFLLLADLDDQLASVASALASAAENGTISRDRLAQSAAKMRDLAQRYQTSV